VLQSGARLKVNSVTADEEVDEGLHSEEVERGSPFALGFIF